MAGHGHASGEPARLAARGVTALKGGAKAAIEHPRWDRCRNRREITAATRSASQLGRDDWSDH
jgi:hypothetical protein